MDQTTLQKQNAISLPLAKQNHFSKVTASAATPPGLVASQKVTVTTTLGQDLNNAVSALENNTTNDNPENYLRVGELYSCQGWQYEAASILSKGLHIFPRNRQLEEKLTAVKTRLHRRIDFIVECPYDIVYHIINYIDQETIVLSCLDVCHTWRSLLVEYSTLWRSFTIRGITTAINDKKWQEKQNKALTLVCHHVKQMNMMDMCKDQFDKLLMIIMENDFKCLTTLEIKGCRISRYCRLFLDTLSRVKSTLKRLRIHMKAAGAPMPILNILSTCPHLEELYIGPPWFVYIHSLDTDINSRVSFEMLVDLRLHCFFANRDMLEYLLQRCPNLQKPAIGQQYDSCTYHFTDIEFLINSSSKKKKPLLSSSSFDHWEKQEYELYSNSNVDGNRIRNIAAKLYTGEESFTKPIIDLIADNASVIEVLRIDFPISQGMVATHSWHRLLSLTFPQLRCLSARVTYKYENTFARILSRFPMLQELTLDKNDYLGEDLSHTIPKLPELHTLRFIHGCMEEEHIICMLNSLTGYGQLSASSSSSSSSFLRTLSFTNTVLTIPTIQTLAQTCIKTIEHLSLDNVILKEKQQDLFKTFARTILSHKDENSLQGNSLFATITFSIHTISIKNIESMYDDDLNYLENIPSLQRIELICLKNITSKGLEDLRNRNKNITIEYYLDN
ncbi:hypothetical protein BDA99DRAFT_569933 [Phascolomyces articulosus]|uniref:F-box domain-containing protein n=1 Tax=Phascolomyces articulosus TaxID=60185 RepID=A0AAD5K5S2_9FUNG|nr:hypothetical protein BDA99DRAFT_569933 [Phascolomyces articulosus]